MRIVGGQFRAKTLASPPGLSTRPTSDRARQAVFNILEHASWRPFILPENAAVLDVFAGTGALGLESLSRGAAEAVFIEQSPEALKVLRQNIDSMKIGAKTQVLRADAMRPPLRPAALAPRNLVFLDPPYGKNMGYAALNALVAKDWLAPNAVCVMEMSRKQPEPLPEGFTLADTRHYGVAEVRFLLRDV
jgi:16S rRNA (guanine966-N2)-methyltransferase